MQFHQEQNKSSIIHGSNQRVESESDEDIGEVDEKCDVENDYNPSKSR